jgi:hypothetical protein
MDHGSLQVQDGSSAEVAANLQLGLLAWSGDYLERCSAKGIDTGASAICRLDSSHDGPGRARLELARRSDVAQATCLRLAALAARAPLAATDYVPLQGAGDVGDIDVIVVTWVKEADFAPDGSLRDRYFGVSSAARPKTLWIALSLDGQVPPEVAPEIRVLVPRRSGVTPVLRRAAQAIGVALRAAGSPARMAHAFTSACTPAEAVCSEIEAVVSRGEPLTVLLPYEGQPFQHQIASHLRRVRRNVHVVGYMHSMLPALPTDYHVREGSPDELVVHGPAQRDIAVGLLRWPAARVRVCPSLRYRDAVSGRRYAGQVVMPYDVREPDRLLASFERFLRAVPPGELPPLAPREHPVVAGSPGSLELRLGIERALSEHGGTAPGVTPVCVVLGVSATLFEALESGIRVASVVADPVLDGYGTRVWADLVRDEIAVGSAWVALRRPGAYIQFGSSSDDLDTLLRPGAPGKDH